jgi:hypothetical protein
LNSGPKIGRAERFTKDQIEEYRLYMEVFKARDAVLFPVTDEVEK